MSNNPDLLNAKIIALHLQGMGKSQISRELTRELGEPVGYKKITSALESKEYKKLIAEQTEEILSLSKAVLRDSMARILPKLAKLLEREIERGNINAVPQVLKIIGIEADDKPQQKQNLTVVLPKFDEPRPVVDISKKTES